VRFVVVRKVEMTRGVLEKERRVRFEEKYCNFAGPSSTHSSRVRGPAIRRLDVNAIDNYPHTTAINVGREHIEDKCL